MKLRKSPPPAKELEQRLRRTGQTEPLKKFAKELVTAHDTVGESAEESTGAWARKLSDKELIARMIGYLGDAALPKAVGVEIKKRWNAHRRKK